MIKQKTVLVLGAGASFDYGYPLARELIADVIRVLDDQDKRGWFGAAGISTSDIQEFRHALTQMGESSVDAFLQYRPEFVHAGKLAIALALAPYEKHTQKPLQGGAYRWYEHLFGALNASAGRWPANQLSVVTFNYDRSLDQYMFSALSTRYDWGAEQTARELAETPIIHVHGQIGLLPWQADKGGWVRKYGRDMTPESLQAAASTLKIISEEVETPELDHARELISEADRVHFLGFGYHAVNLNRLHIRQQASASGKKASGTAVGLGGAERAEIEERWPIRLAAPGLDILGFFKEDTVLEG